MCAVEIFKYHLSDECMFLSPITFFLYLISDAVCVDFLHMAGGGVLVDAIIIYRIIVLIHDLILL